MKNCMLENEMCPFKRCQIYDPLTNIIHLKSNLLGCKFTLKSIYIENRNIKF